MRNGAIFIGVILLSLFVSTSLGIFGATRSSCSRNSQCRSFGRRQCLGTEFVLCFGPSRPYTLPGRCLRRSNPLCDLGNLFSNRKKNCIYYECAECLGDQDCGHREHCSNYYCARDATPPPNTY